MKIVKRSLFLVFIFSLLIFISLESIYFYKLKDLNLYLIPSKNSYPQSIIEIQWIEHQGRGKLNMEKMSPFGYILSFLRIFLNDEQVKSHDVSNFFPNGSEVAHFASRNLLSGKKVKNWHLSNMVASIWVSRNWSAKQAISVILDNSYYGFNITGIENASNFYYKKTIDMLNTHEIVTLIATQKAPSKYNPFCNVERISQWGKSIQEKLNFQLPSSYGSYIWRVV